MKRNHPILSIMIIACMALILNGKASAGMWDKVEKARRDGLPKTAVSLLKEIETEAFKKNNDAEYLKAATLRIKIESDVEGGNPEIKIRKLQEIMSDAKPEHKAVFQLIEALWFTEYYHQNRYRFVQRTQTQGLTDDDFTTWDLPKLFERIDEIYQSVLERKDILKSISNESLDGVLTDGDKARELRPSLYNFALHQAIEFYRLDDQSVALPEDAFIIDGDSAAFGNLEEFLEYSPETSNTDSPVYKALILFQELLQYNLSTENIPAMVDDDIQRLLFVRKEAYGQDLDERLIERLERLAERHPGVSPASRAYYQIAQTYYSNDDYVKAHQYADKGVLLHPESVGGNNCKALIEQIEAEELRLHAEKTVMPGIPGRIKIEYRNIETVYFRLYRQDWKEGLKNKWGGIFTSNEEEMKKLLKKKPLFEWKEILKPAEDYQLAATIAELPDLDHGFYRIFGSIKSGFGDKANVVESGTFFVTDLGLVIRKRHKRIEGIVTDNFSGEPVKEVTINVYSRRNDGVFEKTDDLTSNAEGMFTYDVVGRRRDCVIQVVKGKSELAEGPLYPAYERTLREYEKVYFFTDRSLYRPGQMVHFKGIAFMVDKAQDRYKTLAGRKITVYFRDRNRQEIESQSFETNEFGSFSGVFVAPSGSVTGQMTISSDNPSGSAAVRVEEYKRPKFRVELQTPEEAIRLGEKVSIKGKAVSYTGAPVDSASVNYRVTRQARFPFWMRWYAWNIDQLSQAQEIAHGRVKTDKNGSFTITFKAKPDPRIPESDDPVFNYKISADCTDITGETRSDTLSVSIGYTAMKLTLKTDSEWLLEDIPFNVDLSAESLAGPGVRAEGTVTVYELQQPDAPVCANLFSNTRGPEKLNQNLADYRLWSKGDLIRQKNFRTDAGKPLQLDFALPAGAYLIQAKSEDRFGKTVEAKLPVIVFAPQSDHFPVNAPFYSVCRENTIEPGNDLKMIWATGYDSGRAYIEVEQDGNILESFWTEPDRTQFIFTYPIDESLRGGCSVHVTFVRENRAYLESHYITVPWSNKELELSFSTFRSELLPGQEEEWALTIKGKNAQIKAAELAATLYDESLDAFYPHSVSSLSGHLRRHQQALRSNYVNQAVTLNYVIYDLPRYRSFTSPSYWRFADHIVSAFGYYHRGTLYNEMLSDGNMGISAAAPRGAGKRLGAPPPQAAETMAFKSKADAAAPMEEAPPDDEEAAAEPGIDLEQVSIRRNLNETAFFYPHLLTDESGEITIKFKMPEALTQWKFLGLAHSTGLESGIIEEHTVTRKKLMVQPNPPRFLREGDILEFAVKIVNTSDKDMKGSVRLSLADARNMENIDEEFGNDDNVKSFAAPAGESRAFSWRLEVPDWTGVVLYRAVASSGDFSDGEEKMLPVLSRRIEVKESIPLHIRGPGKEEFEFEKLKDSFDSETLEHLSYTVQMASNPAWYAVQALPYLMEFPHECSEQVFNRIYADSLAAHIVNSDPKIKRVFDQRREDGSLQSNLEKNEELKNVLLRETPWLLDAENETQAMRKVALLFDRNTLNASMAKAMDKLRDMQHSDGSWPWFPGGRANSYITLYIVTGFGRLRHLGVDADIAPAVKALEYIDKEIDEKYRYIREKLNPENNHLSHWVVMYLYGRSFFLNEKPIPPKYREALDYFIGQAGEYWLKLDSRMSQGHVALGLQRLEKDNETPKKIVSSLKERSLYDEEMGMYWREYDRFWYWYKAPIETQAVMIEVFDEVADDQKAVEDCKVWLLKQKQTQSWKTTKATADAVYALLLKGTDLLASDRIVEVKLGDETIKPENIEAGTGFYEKRYQGNEIKQHFSDIEVIKQDKGVAWGGVHWSYLEDMSKITPHQTGLSLEKSLFVAETTKKGEVIKPVRENDILKPGDLVTVRIELRTDRDLEYVHMKDMRGSGMEPVDVLSEYRYQDGLYYYQSTKDTATHFFIDYLARGTYVFEYDLRVQHRGKYQTGTANIQCMYAPEFSSHSQSFMVEVQ